MYDHYPTDAGDAQYERAQKLKAAKEEVTSRLGKEDYDEPNTEFVRTPERDAGLMWRV